MAKPELIKFLLALHILVLIPLVTSFPTIDDTKIKEPRCPPQHDIDPCYCQHTTTVLELTCYNVLPKRLLEITKILRDDAFLINSMTIMDSDLVSLSAETFVGLQIEELSIINCNFSNLAQAVFTPLGESLTELILARNRITEIPDDAFSQLKSLKVLDLSHNKIRQLSTHSLSGLEGLAELRLHSNDLETVDPQAFDECCRELLVLNLASNLLSTVPTDAFAPLANLTYLKLHDNNIKTINKRAFEGLNAVNTIDLSNNLISTVEDNAFGSATVHSLILKNNNIKTLPGLAFAGLESTTEWLDLSYNEFLTVPSAALSLFRSLRHLNLAHNQITHLQEGTFASFGEHLRYIELNDNNIQYITPNAFQDLQSVEFLMLSHNNLTTLTQKIMEPTLDTMFLFDISENPLACGCELKWLKDWLASVNPLDRLTPEPTCLSLDEGQMLFVGKLVCDNKDGTATMAPDDRMCTSLDCFKSLATFFSKNAWWYT